MTRKRFLEEAIRLRAQTSATVAVLVRALARPEPSFSEKYTASVLAERCSGCGDCVDACPYDAIRRL